jgi:hypothetical protein
MKKGYHKGHMARYDAYNFVEELGKEAKKNKKGRKI